MEATGAPQNHHHTLNQQVGSITRLTLTIIIISPVIYFSWDAVKGTSGSDYVESVVFILMAGFAMSVCYLFFSVLEKVINARKSKDESIYHD
ncbi:conjugal transfer protein TrbE [Klebsiella quasipneumoniae subsp. quasipneumoniae]|uniref:conjugal transfer protein TrbE n=1 Tax=Enterobacteriaceae TaxID=543 RepID=UPI0011121398|nr:MULTISPECIES: conjugal transfer protein TrbE [Enterobacteriaceae]MCW9157624.1 conjugal transfer protein TrbE [Klebsiella quasipneumoniae]MCW9179060.1 conjugal transfer protein TrbE [Klebsiella pneumoniae]MCW9254819.1 conjugal transfer protein TrbE [Klebsiella aerogenes]MCW9340967.1 conjugal transfer protein TrbE [Klebsiella michiganensis]MCW9429390.1 conjugal transfer protein TrbE [Klebsiella pneumoniae]